jgi:hypothetical protein
MKTMHKVTKDRPVGKIWEHKVMPYFKVVLDVFQKKQPGNKWKNLRKLPSYIPLLKFDPRTFRKGVGFSGCGADSIPNT